MDAIVKEFAVLVVSLCMDRFGSKSKKPTKLYADVAWIADIAGAEPCEDTCPDLDAPETYLTYFNKNGEPKVTGGPGLKQTQAYTPAFGREVRRVWEQNCVDKFARRPAVEQDLDHVKTLLHMEEGDMSLLSASIYIYIYIYI